MGRYSFRLRISLWPCFLKQLSRKQQKYWRVNLWWFISLSVFIHTPSESLSRCFCQVRTEKIPRVIVLDNYWERELSILKVFLLMYRKNHKLHLKLDFGNKSTLQLTSWCSLFIIAEYLILPSTILKLSRQLLMGLATMIRIRAYLGTKYTLMIGTILRTSLSIGLWPYKLFHLLEVLCISLVFLPLCLFCFKISISSMSIKLVKNIRRAIMYCASRLCNIWPVEKNIFRGCVSI